ncbi:tail fiber assembly protein [Fundidesulfovibrio butyratiphilus]
MVIYHYDRSGVYLGSGEATPSPAEGLLPDGTPKAWIVPGLATSIQPPKPGVGEVPVFDESQQAWTLKQDHRGTSVWNTESLAHMVVSGLGPIPEGWTTLQPQDAFQKWDGSKWTVDVDRMAESVRAERNARLLATDWTQMPDVVMADDILQAWRVYRQALRDFMTDWQPGKRWPEIPGES